MTPRRGTQGRAMLREMYQALDYFRDMPERAIVKVVLWSALRAAREWERENGGKP